MPEHLAEASALTFLLAAALVIAIVVGAIIWFTKPEDDHPYDDF